MSEATGERISDFAEPEAPRLLRRENSSPPLNNNSLYLVHPFIWMLSRSSRPALPRDRIAKASRLLFRTKELSFCN